jgi:Putative prokaryotic signal transducing protein
VPYCPNCLTEYVKGTEECEDCGVPLVPGSPPARGDAESSETDRMGTVAGWFRSLVGAGPERDEPEAKMVRIRTFFGNTAMLNADLARNLLRTRGIPSILPGETSVELLPFLEVPLLVREADAERAKSILRDYFDQSATEGPALVE